VRVPLPDGNVFLMNTLTTPKLSSRRMSADLIDDLAAARVSGLARGDAEAVVETLSEHGFLTSRPRGRSPGPRERFAQFREDASELRVTVLTDVQCNFACQYCVQGDHGTYNATARKMSLRRRARSAPGSRSSSMRCGPSGSC